MEKEEKIVKVYSNNSKKSRLKRRKNKFQRIWDAEKQTYIKVRKAKYPVYPKKEKKDWRKTISSAVLKCKQEPIKKKKSVPVIAKEQKPEIKQQPRKQPARVHSKTTVTNVTKIHGIQYTWDEKILKYKKAA